MSVKQISAIDLQKRLQSTEKQPVLLDVREPQEFQYARIEGSMLIPMGEIPQRVEELDAQQEFVVICHHGVRSQQVAEFLVYSGFESIYNLTGGIDTWSSVCDPSVPRY